jgi:hypothetical protein
MTVGRIPNIEGGIQPTIVTTKGDLIAATAASNPARLAVGADGTTLVADSSAATGLAYIPTFFAGKNKIMNGDFRFNQRNFSSTTSTLTYGFDRWLYDYSGGTVTYSAQTFTAGTAPVAGYEGINFARLVSASQSGNGDYAGLSQRIEDVRTFANQTITVSFWAKASTGTPQVGIDIAQVFGSGGSATVLSSAVTTKISTISSSWVRYSLSFTIPSISGKTIGTSSYLQLFLWTSVGTTVSGSGYAAVGLQNATIDFWGVQMESGSTASAFQTATGTLQGELAACQRYYWRNTSGVAYGLLASAGAIYSATAAQIGVQFPVPMRVAPTGIEYSSIMVQDSASNNFTPSSATIDSVTSNIYGAGLTCVISAATANRPARLLANNSTTAYIGASAEL